MSYGFQNYNMLSLPVYRAYRTPSLPVYGTYEVPSLPVYGTYEVPSLPVYGTYEVPSLPVYGTYEVPSLPVYGTYEVPSLPVYGLSMGYGGYMTNTIYVQADGPETIELELATEPEMELLVAQEPATPVVDLRVLETDTDVLVEELTLSPVQDIKLLSNELSKETDEVFLEVSEEDAKKELTLSENSNFNGVQTTDTQTAFDSGSTINTMSIGVIGMISLFVMAFM